MARDGLLRSLFAGKAKPEVERRRSVRQANVFQVAKFTTDALEELCVLRDVSATGLRAQTYCTLAPGDPITFELRTEHRVAGRVAWADEGVIGVQFDVEVPILAMLAHCAVDDRLAKMRPPRLTTALSGSLSCGGEDWPITALNISQAGMKLAIGRPVTPDTRCTVRLEGLAPRIASLRWYRDGEAGLLLDEPLDFAAFAAWRRELHRRSRADPLAA